MHAEEPGLLARVGHLLRSVRRWKRENCSKNIKGNKQKNTGAKWICLRLGVYPMYPDIGQPCRTATTVVAPTEEWIQ